MEGGYQDYGRVEEDKQENLFYIRSYGGSSSTYN